MKSSIKNLSKKKYLLLSILSFGIKNINGSFNAENKKPERSFLHDNRYITNLEKQPAAFRNLLQVFNQAANEAKVQETTETLNFNLLTYDEFITISQLPDISNDPSKKQPFNFFEK